VKPLVKSFVVTAWACLLVSGCGRRHASPSWDVPTDIVTWDQGAVYHLGTVFVIWTDGSAGGYGSSHTTRQSMKCQGNLRTRDGRTVEFQCETPDRKTGQATVNVVTYDLKEGNLFLVTTEGDQIKVKQLKRNLSDLKFDRDSLQAFGKKDPDVAEFFAKDKKPK
jgi:hypothetical protein